MQKPKPPPFHVYVHIGYASDVATGPFQASDKAELDGIYSHALLGRNRAVTVNAARRAHWW